MLKLFVFISVILTLEAIGGTAKKQDPNQDLKEEYKNLTEQNRILKEKGKFSEKIQKIQSENQILVEENACLEGDGEKCASAGNFHLQKKKKENASKFWTKGCELGNSESCYFLGVMEQQKKVAEKAKSYFEKACEGNYAMACNNLAAVEYKNKNFENVKKYFAKACALKLPEACANLAKFEKAETEKLLGEYREKCLQGSAVDCYNHGYVLLKDGDAKMAQKSFFKACGLKDTLSCAYHGTLSGKKEVTNKVLTEFFPRCEEKNEAEVCLQMAAIYALNSINDSALEYLEKAVQKGYPKPEDAQNMVEFKDLKNDQKFQSLTSGHGRELIK